MMACAAVLGSSEQAFAGVFTVNTWKDKDDGVCEAYVAGVPGKDCSMREAVNLANATTGSDTIYVGDELRFYDITLSVDVKAYAVVLDLSAPGEEDGNAEGDLDLWDGDPGTELLIEGIDVSVPGGPPGPGYGSMINSLPSTARERSLHAIDPFPFFLHPVDLRITNMFLVNGQQTVTGTVGGGIIAVEDGDLEISVSDLSGGVLQRIGTVGVGGGCVYVNGTVTVDGSKIAQCDSIAGHGGAIYATDDVTITDSELLGNDALNEADGGGFYVDSNAANVVVTRTLVGFNSANRDGGGAWVRAGSLSLVDSEFEANRATNGGGLYAFSFPGATVPLVNRSTFVGNRATAAGRGAGMYLVNNGNGSLVVRNSTFFDNRNAASVGPAADGASIYLAVGTGAPFLNLEHVVIDGDSRVGSETFRGRSVHDAWAFGGVPAVSLLNSFISGACTGTTPTSLGGNAYGTGLNACGAFFDTPMTFAPYPAFQNPMSFFAPSLTRLHDPASEFLSGLAILVNNASCVSSAIADDQRGAIRPVGTNCDIGAFEQ